MEIVIQSFNYYIVKMTSLLTITFSGRPSSSSVLQCNFLPEIMLDANYDYSCALLDLFIANERSENLGKIVESGVIQIKCDIISESLINGERNHIIHQFYASTSHVKGLALVEIPKHLNYFRVKVKNLRSIQISIVDQKGKQLDIHDSDIICRLNIKRESINEKSD